MPTICGQRRRGATPASIRALAEDVGVTKVDSVIDVTRLENAVRDDLNRRAPRRMCVLRPLKVTITNWADDGDEGRTEWLEAINNPEDEGAGKRQVPFTRSLYIERDDFLEDAPRKWFRLAPGAEVRLRYGYWIRCTEAVKNASGEVVELKCTYDPATRGGDSPPPDADGNVRKVKGTLHWVSAEHATPVEVRLFDRLFTTEEPGRTTGNFLDDLNPDSLSVLTGCMIEPNWRRAEVERIAAAADADPAVPNAFGEGNWVDGIERFQFERQGYFCVDPDSTAERPVFNRTVTLKDTWAKVAGKG
jgi:glutaminyl-tRNA synthetase